MRSPAAGDIFTARELGAALQSRYNVEVRYLPRGSAWYSAAQLEGLDVLVAMLDAYDLGRALAVSSPVSPHRSILDGRASGAKHSLVAVAWMRNWFQRWLARPWLGNYDLLMVSSQPAMAFLGLLDTEFGMQVQCAVGCPEVRVRYIGNDSLQPIIAPLVTRRINVPLALLPLATNDRAFEPPQVSNLRLRAPSRRYSADYAFTGSYHDSPRAVMDFDPQVLLPRWRGVVVGEGWHKPTANVSAAWRAAAVGRAPYGDIPEVEQ